MLIESENGVLRAVGSDGYRLTIASKPVNVGPKFTFVISQDTVKWLLSALRNSLQVKIKGYKRFIVFETEKWKFMTRPLEGEYPDYKSVIPKTDTKMTIGFNREELLNTVKRVMIVHNEYFKPVRFSFLKEATVVESVSSEGNKARAKINSWVKGGDIEEIVINGRFLVDVLACLKGTEIQIKIRDKTSPVLLEEAGNDQFLYIVMPMIV